MNILEQYFFVFFIFIAKGNYIIQMRQGFNLNYTGYFASGTWQTTITNNQAIIIVDSLAFALASFLTL